MENGTIMSAQQPPQQQSRPEGHRVTGSDGSLGEPYLQQIINERNLLRSQNDQLWKIIEKQKSVITNLQKDNQKIANERDRLIAKLNSSRSEDEVISPIERRGSESKTPVEFISITNANDNNDSAVLSQQFNMDNNKSQDSSTQPSQTVRQLPSNYKQSSLPDKGLSSHATLEPKPQSQRQDSVNSVFSDVSTNSSVSGLLNAYDESNTQAVPNDDFSTNLTQQQEIETNQLKNESNSPMNENVLPPKSVQRQHSLQNNNHSSFPQEIQNSPLNYFENFESSTSIPSPTISIKSSESGSVSSSGDASKRKRNSTIQPTQDDNDALDQFPNPPQSPQSPDLKERKVPEPIELSSPSTIPPRSPRSPRSPGLPSSPRPPRSPTYDSEVNTSSNNAVNQDNVNYSKYLQSNTIEKNLPVRSQSLPHRDQPSISVSGNSEEDQTNSKRDSLTHNNSDSNLSGTYLAPKDSKPLRSSKSFTHVQPGPRARVSAMPPPRGGQFPPELHVPGSNTNTLFIPNQNNRHSVFMTQSQRDNPAFQHKKNKMSLPDATVVTNPFYGQPQPPQMQQQQMPQQMPQQIPQQVQQQQQQQQQQQLPQMPPPSEKQPFTLDVISGITVKVIGSNKKTNDKGKEVLAFVLSVGHARIHDGTIVGMDKELWRVEKLYSDFLALDSKLKQRQNKSTINKIGKLPDKNLFHNNAPSKVDQRKIALEQYLQHVISLPLKDSKDLCEFLSSNVIDQEEKEYQQSGYKEGYLTKKGKNFGGWKSRYFVLSSPVLEYYESKGGSQLGFIRLTHAQIGRQQSNNGNETDKDSENAYRHAFLILEPRSGTRSHTKHVLCAESDAERDEWVESLLQYVGVSDEDEREVKKHSKKKFSKDSIAKVNAQPISQLGKNDLNTKLITTDSVIQQAQKEIRPDRRRGNNDSLSSINSARGDGINHSSHHPSSSLSSSPSSSLLSTSTNSLQQLDQLNDQSKNSFNGNQQQSMLGVSSNSIVKRGSVLAGREEPDRKTFNGTPEPRDSTSSPVLGMSVNNQQQTLNTKRQPDDSNLHHEKRKGSRKTFFGNMFSSSSKDEKKKYQEIRHEASRTVVFGVPLDQAIAVARIKEGYELPAVVYRCIEYLDAKNATEEEGIYRLNGAAATIKLLKDRFNTEGDVDLLGEGDYYDVHAVAGLLKLYLRELPTSVLTRELHAEFVNVIDLLDRRDRINELGRLVSSLPLANYTLLRTLTGHLIRVVQNADVNKMTVRNIGIVFSPTLGIPAGVFSLFMAEFDYIFFTDSNGTAAPRSIDSPPSEKNENERTNSVANGNNALMDVSQLATNDGAPHSPTALSPITALRHRNLREDVNGRSNRNSMHYMDGAPENVVGLERKLTVTKTLRRNDDSSDEEEVNDLALQADDDDAETSSADESTSSPPNSSIRSAPVSAPVSPRLPAPNGFSRSNSSSGVRVDDDTVPELEMNKIRRLTVRNYTERDSMYEVFSENQKMLDALNSQDEDMNQRNIQNLNLHVTNKTS